MERSCHNRMGKGGEEKGRGVRWSNKNRSGEGKIFKKGRVREVSCHKWVRERRRGKRERGKVEC